jgi:hypothetical protein
MIPKSKLTANVKPVARRVINRTRGKMAQRLGAVPPGKVLPGLGIVIWVAIFKRYTFRRPKD